MGLFRKRKPNAHSWTIDDAFDNLIESVGNLDASAADLFAELVEELPESIRDRDSDTVGLALVLASFVAADLTVQGFGAGGLILEALNEDKAFVDGIGPPPPVVMLRLARRTRGLCFAAAAAAADVALEEQREVLTALGFSRTEADQLLPPEPVGLAAPEDRPVWLILGAVEMGGTEMPYDDEGEALTAFLRQSPGTPWSDGLLGCLADDLEAGFAKATTNGLIGAAVEAPAGRMLEYLALLD